jgi:microtubule-associated protein-like 6
LATKQKNIQQICFIGDGKLIASIAQDNSVVVVDWVTTRVLANVKGEPATTTAIAAVPGKGDEICFLSCGDKYIRLWTLKGSALTSLKVSVTALKGATIQNFLCAVVVKGITMVGCADGSVYVVAGKAVSGSFKGSKADSDKDSVLSMHFDSAIEVLFCGTASGKVTCWDTAMLNDSLLVPSLLSEISVDSLVSYPSAKQIHSVASVKTTKGARVVFGTRGCDILEIDYAKDPAYSCTPQMCRQLISSHCDGEVWGLAVHTFLPLCCSTGDDRTLRVWDLKRRAQIAFIPLGGYSRACAYEPTECASIAVGYGGKVGQPGSAKLVKEGTVRMYSSIPPFKILAEVADSKKPISDIKFTCDGMQIYDGLVCM